MSRSPWDHEPVDDRRIDLLMPAPHDGGALLPDASGNRRFGHATAPVSRQYLGSGGQVGNGMVAATTVRADERVPYPPHAVPPYGVAVEPKTPLMTETGESPHTVADHPADAMHLPLPSGPLTPCHPPLPRCRAPENCPPATDAGRRDLRLLPAPTPRQRAPSCPTWPAREPSACAAPNPPACPSPWPRASESVSPRHPAQHCGRGKPPSDRPRVSTLAQQPLSWLQGRYETGCGSLLT
ncbi:transposase [Streptomyces ipomoeae]|uniref:transposase n=1 Tax=Streptomyces ipomoeae TaxID=103232 RepID=UPI0011465C0B|nr:hypothetical protein SipoB123_22175 [Streptomyces ipomoeae]